MTRHERRTEARQLAREAAGNVRDVLLGVLLYAALVGLTLAGMAWRGL